jgi:hypothetical protein
MKKYPNDPAWEQYWLEFQNYWETVDEIPAWDLERWAAIPGVYRPDMGEQQRGKSKEEELNEETAEFLSRYCDHCGMRRFRCVCDPPCESIGRAIMYKPEKPLPEVVAACGSLACSGCYDVGDGIMIHPPRAGYDRSTLLFGKRKIKL